MLELNYPLAELHGAEYNPRLIDEKDFEALKESLAELGIVKPIIARGHTIVAGHQRTRAARAIKVTHAPVYLLSTDTSTYDEVRFNQLHNGTDMDDGAGSVRITRDLSGVSGWITLKPGEIAGDFRCKGAALRKEIASLIASYGPWGGIVATQDGRVIHCAQYALAAAATGSKITAYIVPPDRADAFRRRLDRTYGVFSYEKLPRHTYIQTFAQMFRLREGAKRGNLSPTYEKHVKPYLATHPGSRAVDFGCGQGDYVRDLVGHGVNIIGCELFPRAGRDAIDVAKAQRMVRALAASLKTEGRFDAVVCDYVLNSVDSVEAERSVLAILDLLCKPGGRLFFSARKRERIEDMTRVSRAAGNGRAIEFLDSNGFSALYRKGQWFYQRFHTKEELHAIADRHGWTIDSITESSTTWNVSATSARNVLSITEYKAAIRFDFNLPVNAAGRRLGMADEMMEAMRCTLT